jgi:exodeoxyribonuclease V alpha subunit
MSLHPDASNPPLTAQQALEWLNRWTELGLLRHIDSAWAAQVLRLQPQARPASLVAAALLAQMEGRGYTCLPLRGLCHLPADMLGWPPAAVEGAQGLQALWQHLPSTPSGWYATLQGDCALLEDMSERDSPLVLGGSPEDPVLYLRRYAMYERRVGLGLLSRAAEAIEVPEAAALEWLNLFFGTQPDRAETIDWQKIACAVALRARLAVITGGPGTGKTYTAARLLALSLALQGADRPLRVALAAPTGKAAARLKQSIDQALLALHVPPDSGLDLKALTDRMGPARTLHSLLGARPDTRQFKHHATHPLDIDLLIVDEASMVHLEMMDALLQALPPSARLVLLGDKDQLASVEAGAVLGDLCRDASAGRYSDETARYVRAVTGVALPATCLAVHESAPALAQQIVMLRASHRFKGAIGQLAMAVNRGDATAARAAFRQDADAGAKRSLWTQQSDSSRAVCDLATGQADRASYADFLHIMRSGPADGSPETHAKWVTSVLQAFDRFRILCAVHQGAWGTQSLNAAVLHALAEQDWLRPQGEWFAGRPVMVTRNDAQLGVFNGDVGVVLPNTAGVLKVWFLNGGALRSVSVMRLAHVETAFVMTVHKSQGSEFEHTTLVLPPGGGEVLTRELVYTGITRASKQFTLVEAQGPSLEAAVAKASQRASGLYQWWHGRAVSKLQ